MSNHTPTNSLEAMQAEIDRRKAAKPMFPHDVPEVEPPIGTVAVFRHSFQSGAGSSSNMMVRTERGWQERPGDSRYVKSWQSLTDMNYINGETLKDNPSSTALFIGVQVQIIAQASTDTKYQWKHGAYESDLYDTEEQALFWAQRATTGADDDGIAVRPVHLGQWRALNYKGYIEQEG